MRMTACSAKSFEELIYGHSYESELGELRKLVSDYKPKEAKKKERGGGRATSAAAGKKRDKGSDDILGAAMSPLARQSSASTSISRTLLMPLYSQYPTATTPVSASRYEIAYGASTANMPPRRKSLDANMLYGPQAGHHAHAPHHTHSSTSLISPSPSSLYATPSAYHDSDPGHAFSSSSLTPSHGGMRHRPNFASAAAAAAAAADSVVAYVASTPTMAVMNGGWAGGMHSPKATQRESSASAFSFAPVANTSAIATASSNQPTASSATSVSSLAQPASSPPPSSSRAPLVHSPSQSSSLLAPVTLASIKTSPPQLSAKLTSLPPPTLSSTSAFLSPAVPTQPVSSASSDPNSRASSRSNTPQPASPALAPPRPTILIPNSPLTTDTTDDGSSSGTGINVTGGSDVIGRSGDAENEEDDGDIGRRLKAERKRRKKERRDERRGNDKGGEKPEEIKGALSWRPQANAAKEERKEQHIDTTKPSLPTAAAAGGAVITHPDALPVVPTAAAAERALPFADVTPPPSIDFPLLSATAPATTIPLSSLLRRAAVSCALFTVLRFCVSYASPAATALDHNTALMLFLTCILAALFLLGASLSFASRISASVSAPSASQSSLSSELSRYLQTWDLVALSDPQQLLAAYSMTQQVLLSLMHALQPASSTSPPPSLSPASLVSHAQSVLSFLDVAHQHLYSDTGYTLLLDRLLSAATAVRHHVQQLSFTLAQRSSAPPSALASSAMLLQLLSGCCLVGYVVLPCPALRWSVTSAVVHLLLPAALLALELWGLFVVLEGEQRVRSREGVDAREVDGLLELKQRMDKQMEALVVHTAQSS